MPPVSEVLLLNSELTSVSRSTFRHVMTVIAWPQTLQLCCASTALGTADFAEFSYPAK